MAGSWEIRFTVFLLLAGSALAQPRRPEIFLNIGVMRAGGDEGSLGSGAAYGGAVMLPFTRRLAVDLDVQVSKVVNDIGGNRHELRRWLIMPSLVYRFGTEKVYGFTGGGVGAAFDRLSHTEAFPIPRPVGPDLFAFESKDTDRTLHALGGVVVNPLPHLVVRFDLYVAFQFVLPNAGVKAGVGYRF
jgi:hypothetical protein